MQEIGECRGLAAAHRRQLERRQQLVARGGQAGVGGRQVVFRARDVGPAAQQLGRQPGRHGRRAQMRQRQAACDGAGVAADQHRQRVFLFKDLSLQLRHLLGCRMVFGLRLQPFQARTVTHLELLAGQLARLFAQLQGRLRQRQLRVQPAQIQVRRGHAGGDRQRRRIEAGLLGAVALAGSIAEFRQPAPHIDFIAGLQLRLEDVCHVGHAAGRQGARARGRAVEGQVGRAVGVGLRQARAVFLHAGARHAQVAIARQRLAHQVAQHGVAKGLPPQLLDMRTAGRWRAGGQRAPARWQLQCRCGLRRRVGGTAGQRQRAGNQ
ncbi:hypothetical protein D3C81_789470 [compost metagenome]